MSTNNEAAVRPTNAYWVAETTDARGNPLTPSDPAWELFSTTVTNIAFSPNPQFDGQMGVGNYINRDHVRVQEEHEVSVTYDLERHPVDGSGNPQDPLAYAALRDAYNDLYNTLSVLEVATARPIIARNTVHDFYFDDKSGSAHPSGSIPSATEKDMRVERYARGCVPEEAVLSTGDGDTGAASIELTAAAHKLRIYQFDQPSSEYIHVRSTLDDGSSNTTDTGATVHIEPASGGGGEDISLDGSDASTAVGSSSTYDSLRVHLPAELKGTLEVYGDDGSGTSAPGNPDQLLAYIPGYEDYNGIAGDTGVPPLGSSGSYGTGSNLSPVPALGSDLRWKSRPAGEQVSGVTLTVSNEVAQNATDEGLIQDIRVGGQEITVEAEVWGEAESPQSYQNRLVGGEGELRMDLGSGGDAVLPAAKCVDGGTTEREEGAAVMQVGVSFEGNAPSDGSSPIQFPTT